jgi:hypothetical protein
MTGTIFAVISPILFIGIWLERTPARRRNFPTALPFARSRAIDHDYKEVGKLHGKGDFIAPGKPVLNGFVDSNGSFRDECLNETLFLSLTQARMKKGVSGHIPCSSWGAPRRLAKRTASRSKAECRVGSM